MNHREIKQFLISKIIEEIDERISAETQMIESARETANSDTKSSAGDKYETTRAMMHLEQEKYSQQLAESLELKKKTQLIPIDSTFDKVQSGTVVCTSIGNFFIAISAEEIELEDEEYTPISLASPIGEALNGKTSGVSFIFRQREVKILELF